ncbi:MAG: hypothetical protein WDZ80_05125 [Candidatus Paceibacterota bacterium]
MTNIFTYLLYRIFYRIGDFLNNWYIRSSRNYWHWVITKIQRIDYRLAWKITLKNLFKPLYKDYSFVGYVVGFFLRIGRLFFSSIIYLIILSIASLIYLFWISLPILIILQIIL